MRKIKGFSLPEIMIVTVIVVLLAAISIPHLLRTRVNFFESSAVASIRTISDAAQSYRAANTRYPLTLASLGPPTGGTAGGQVYCAAIAQPYYLEAKLGCPGSSDGVSGCLKDNYLFWLSGSVNTFVAKAMPRQWSGWGRRAKKFYIDQNGIIRYTNRDFGWQAIGNWDAITAENTKPLDYH